MLELNSPWQLNLKYKWWEKNLVQTVLKHLYCVARRKCFFPINPSIPPLLTFLGGQGNEKTTHRPSLHYTNLTQMLIVFGRARNASFIISFIYFFLLQLLQKRARRVWGRGWNGLKSIVTYLYCQSMTNDNTFAISLALCQCVILILHQTDKCYWRSAQVTDEHCILLVLMFK